MRRVQLPARFRERSSPYALHSVLETSQVHAYQRPSDPRLQSDIRAEYIVRASVALRFVGL